MTDVNFIPVTDKRTGKTTFAQPGNTPKRKPADPDTGSPAPLAATNNPDASAIEQNPPEEGVRDEESSPASGASHVGRKSRPKVELHSLEQFLANAYSQKGRPVALKPKVQEAIAKNTTLDEDARAHLRTLTSQDKLLAVPRQLLLVSITVREFPRLRDGLRDFARTTLLAHPIFQTPALVAALRNLDEAPPTDRALSEIQKWRPPEFRDRREDELKPSELDELRRNSAYALLTWVAIERSLSKQDIISAAHNGLWSPRSASIAEDRVSLIRAITDIDEVASVGLVCNALAEHALLMASRADTAQRDAAAARSQVVDLEAQITSLNRELAEARADHEQIRRELEQSIRQVRDQSENNATHQRYNYEQLRTRVLKRLTSTVELLEVGLSAMRLAEPKAHVLKDRAERVADSLRDEISSLRGGS